jgi:hypothetical protein
MYERKDLGSTPIIKGPAIRRGKTLPVLVTQLVHVQIALFFDVVNPND